MYLPNFQVNSQIAPLIHIKEVLEYFKNNSTK